MIGIANYILTNIDEFEETLKQDVLLNENISDAILVNSYEDELFESDNIDFEEYDYLDDFSLENDDVEYIENIDISNFEKLNEKALSKSQRRLFAMALAYKRGNLSNKYASDAIKKLSKLSEKTLRDYAKTKEIGPKGENLLPNKIK